VNSIINFWVPKMLGNYRVAWQLVAPRVVLSCIVSWLWKLVTTILGVGSDWVHLARRPLFGRLLYQHRMIDDDDECGSVGEHIGKGNRSTQRKPAPVPLCQSQNSHYLTWARTQDTAVRSRRLTTWAMAWPK
jgi:hypothetical protein